MSEFELTAPWYTCLIDRHILEPLSHYVLVINFPKAIMRDVAKWKHNCSI